MKRDFTKAKELFLKSLNIDPKDEYANYQLGVMTMLGLGEESDVT